MSKKSKKSKQKDPYVFQDPFDPMPQSTGGLIGELISYVIAVGLVLWGWSISPFLTLVVLFGLLSVLLPFFLLTSVLAVLLWPFFLGGGKDYFSGDDEDSRRR